MFSADILASKPVASLLAPESLINVGKDVSSSSEKLTVNDQEGLHLEVSDPAKSLQSSPIMREINSNLLNTTDQNGGKIFASFLYFGIKKPDASSFLFINGRNLKWFLQVQYVLIAMLKNWWESCSYWCQCSLPYIIDIMIYLWLNLSVFIVLMQKSTQKYHHHHHQK